MKGPFENYKIGSPTYTGFYRGVVEDNSGDNQMCRIRVVSVHHESPSIVPTNTLPWAEKAGPLFGEGGVSAGGVFGVPRIGAVVWVFFEAGNPQKPIYFATSSGVPSKQADFSTGFPVVSNPQNVKKSKEDSPGANDYYELRARNRQKGIMTSGSTTWDEPLPEKSKGNDSNHMLTFTSGMTIEWDADAEAQRMTFGHPSGTFLEMQTKGVVVDKAAADRFVTTHKSAFEWCGGSKVVNSWTYDQFVKTARSTKVLVTDDLWVGAKRSETIIGALEQDVGGYHSIKVGGYESFTVGGYQTIDVIGYQNIKVGGAQSINVVGAQTFTIEGAGLYNYGLGWTVESSDFINIYTNGPMWIGAAGHLDITTASMEVTTGVLNVTGSVINVKAGMIFLN